MEQLMLVNPRKRSHRRSRGFAGVGALRIPRMATIQPMLIGAFQGAAGAIAVNAVLRFLPLPTLLSVGNMMYLTRAAVAIGVGMLAGQVAGGRIGTRMMEGALTVVAVDVIRDLLMTTAGVNLGYYSPARVVGSRPANGNGGAIMRMGGTGKYLSAVSSTGKYLSGNGPASRMAVNGGYGMPA
jgi:hypothetical protein